MTSLPHPLPWDFSCHDGGASPSEKLKESSLWFLNSKNSERNKFPYKKNLQILTQRMHSGAAYSENNMRS